MTTNPINLWLGAVLDAAASHSFIHRAGRPDIAPLRIVVIHRDSRFLTLLRERAACGSLTRRPGGGWQWTVEGTKAVDLANALAPVMHTPIPTTEPETDAPPTVADEASEPTTVPLGVDAATVARELGVTGAYLARLARKLGIGERHGLGMRSVWSFSTEDVAALRDWRTAHGRVAPDATALASTN